MRDEALTQRRRTSLVNIVNLVETSVSVDGAPEVVSKAQTTVESVVRALRCKDAAAVINQIPELLFREKKPQKLSRERPNLKGCSGAILKSIVNILGSDGLPNIFLINRLNVNEVSNNLEKVCLRLL
jgi:hypothetical protein